MGSAHTRSIARRIGYLVAAVLATVTAASCGNAPRGVDLTPAPPVELGKGARALVAGEGAVWVAGPNRVTRIDPREGKVVATIPMGGPTGDIAAGLGRVWVLVTRGDEHVIASIDPRTNRVANHSESIGLNIPSSLAIGDGTIWVANDFDGTVTRVNPKTGKVIGEPIEVESASDLAIGAGSVWVSKREANSVARIDARTGRVLNDHVLISDAPEGIAFGLGSVWVANSNEGTVSRIDASTGRVLARKIQIGDPADSETISFGIASVVAVGFGAVWVPNVDFRKLERIDPSTNRVTGDPIELMSSPARIAAGEGAIWLLMENGSVVAMRPNGAGTGMS